MSDLWWIGTGVMAAGIGMLLATRDPRAVVVMLSGLAVCIGSLVLP